MNCTKIPRVRARMLHIPNGAKQAPIIEGYYVKHALNSGSAWGLQTEIQYQHLIVVDTLTDWGLEPSLKVYEIDVNTLEIMEED